MAGRHSLLAVVLFAVVLHAIAISQTLLPAQDGLKFIRIAREFQSQPWADVDSRVGCPPPLPCPDRGRPSRWSPGSPGTGPTAWRMAAQIVAVLASVGLILPIYGLTLLAVRPADRLPGGRARGLAAARRRAGPRHAER